MKVAARVPALRGGHDEAPRGGITDASLVAYPVVGVLSLVARRGARGTSVFGATPNLGVARRPFKLIHMIREVKCCGGPVRKRLAAKAAKLREALSTEEHRCCYNHLPAYRAKLHKLRSTAIGESPPRLTYRAAPVAR